MILKIVCVCVGGGGGGGGCYRITVHRSIALAFYKIQDSNFLCWRADALRSHRFEIHALLVAEGYGQCPHSSYINFINSLFLTQCACSMFRG